METQKSNPTKKSLTSTLNNFKQTRIQYPTFNSHGEPPRSDHPTQRQQATLFIHIQRDFPAGRQPFRPEAQVQEGHRRRRTVLCRPVAEGDRRREASCEKRQVRRVQCERAALGGQALPLECLRDTFEQWRSVEGRVGRPVRTV